MRQPTGGFSAVRPRPPADAQRMRHMALVLAVTPSGHRRQLTQHLFEILGLAEIAIDRGEAHKATSSRVLNPSADEIADGLRGNIGCTGAFELADDRRNHPLDPVGIDRPLAQRDLDRTHQLVAIEGHPPPRSLDDLQLAQLRPLEGGEAAAAPDSADDGGWPSRPLRDSCPSPGCHCCCNRDSASLPPGVTRGRPSP